MTEEIKERRKLLADALRSGDYIQGQRYLCRVEADGKKHCCLGVACEIYNKHNPDKALDVKIEDAGLLHHQYYGACYALLPCEVAEWYDIQTDGALYPSNDNKLGVALTSLNDSGTPFSEIANIIEGDKLISYNKKVSEHE